MIELPKGWTLEKFDDVGKYTDYVANGSFASLRENVLQKDDEDYAILLRLKDHTNKFKGPFKYVTKSSYEFLAKSKLEPGDLFLANVGAPGRTFLVPELGKPMTIAPNGIRVRANEKSTNQYLNYFIKSPAGQELVTSITGGNAQQKFNKTALRKSVLPIPPLEVQKQLVDKLDSVLAKVEAAQTRLDKIPAILKRFRQSVLSAATSGELTKEWRGDEKYRDETLNWPISKIPESWDLKFLEEVAESRLGKMLDKSKNSGIATKYLGNINLRWHHIDLSELKEILVSQKEIDELNIRDGDLLLCEGGEPGRGAVWKGGDNNLVFQKAIHRVRCTDCISPEFLLYSIEDDFFSNRLSLLYTGTTIKHLTGKALKKYPVRIPPIAEQKEIVQRVNRLLESSSKIEEQYLAAKLRVNQLTQSILKKAFEGELLTSEVENEFLQELSDVEAVEC